MADEEFLQYISNRPMLPEHVKARLEQTDKPTVLEWYSLCTEDCEHGYHVPIFKKCDRCGSQIHRTVVEVFDPERGEITVGSECIKNILGWKWGKSHETALVIQTILDRVLVEVGTPIAILRKRDAGRMLIQTAESGHPYDGSRDVNEPSGEGWKMLRGRVLMTIPGGWTANLLRAAADLGLPWRAVEKDDLDGDGRKRAWYGAGPGWIVGVRGTILTDDMGKQGWRVRNYTKIIASGQLPDDVPGWAASRAALERGRPEAQNDHVEVLTTIGPWVRYRFDHNYWSGYDAEEFKGMNERKENPVRKRNTDDKRFGEEVSITDYFHAGSPKAMEALGGESEDVSCVRCGSKIAHVFMTQYGPMGGDCIATLTGDDSTRKAIRTLIENLKRSKIIVEGEGQGRLTGLEIEVDTYDRRDIAFRTEAYWFDRARYASRTVAVVKASPAAVAAAVEWAESNSLPVKMTGPLPWEKKQNPCPCSKHETNPSEPYRVGNLEVRKYTDKASEPLKFGVWHLVLEQWLINRKKKSDAEDIARYFGQGEGEILLTMAIGGDKEANMEVRRRTLDDDVPHVVKPPPKQRPVTDWIDIPVREGEPLQVPAIKRFGDFVVHHTSNVYNRRKPDGSAWLWGSYTVSYKDGRSLKRDIEKRSDAFALAEHVSGPWKKLFDKVLREESGAGDEMRQKIENQEYLPESKRLKPSDHSRYSGSVKNPCSCSKGGHHNPTRPDWPVEQCVGCGKDVVLKRPRAGEVLCSSCLKTKRDAQRKLVDQSQQQSRQEDERINRQVLKCPHCKGFGCSICDPRLAAAARKNPSGMTWKDYIRGEWWIDKDGESMFADGDIGEANHDMVATDYMVDKDVLIDELLEGEYIDEQQADELRSDEVTPSNVLAQYNVHAGIGKLAVGGNIDKWIDLTSSPSMAFAKHEGAIKVLGRDFYAWTVTGQTIEAIQNFILGLSEFDTVEDPKTEMCVEEHETQRTVCLPVMEFLTMKHPRDLWALLQPEGNPSLRPWVPLGGAMFVLTSQRMDPGGEYLTAQVGKTASGAWMLWMFVRDTEILNIGASEQGKGVLPSLKEVARAVEGILPWDRWNTEARDLLSRWSGEQDRRRLDPKKKTRRSP